MSGYPVQRSDEQWRAQLTEAEYRVLRQDDTEPPFTDRDADPAVEGAYCCRGCGAPLFTAGQRFASHCGWPSFFAPTGQDAVEYHVDATLPGQPRTEVRCATCGGHLGHLFSGEGYPTRRISVTASTQLR